MFADALADATRQRLSQRQLPTPACQHQPPTAAIMCSPTSSMASSALLCVRLVCLWHLQRYDACVHFLYGIFSYYRASLVCLLARFILFTFLVCSGQFILHTFLVSSGRLFLSHSWFATRDYLCLHPWHVYWSERLFILHRESVPFFNFDILY